LNWIKKEQTKQSPGPISFTARPTSSFFPVSPRMESQTYPHADSVTPPGQPLSTHADSVPAAYRWAPFVRSFFPYRIQACTHSTQKSVEVGAFGQAKVNLGNNLRMELRLPRPPVTLGTCFSQPVVVAWVLPNVGVRLGILFRKLRLESIVIQSSTPPCSSLI
jgi:hypothetical protein